MNSYSLGIAGSWILIFILIALALGVAIFSYRVTVPPVSPAKKALLIILRTLGLGLLLFALFEPVLTLVRGMQEEPHLAVFFDNSQSMSLPDAGGDRKAAYRQAVASANPAALDEQYSALLFDSELRTKRGFSFDSLNFRGTNTDLSKPLSWLEDNAGDNNIRASLIISDGAFNAGSNPLNQAELLTRPIYVIGIGDSTDPKDVTIQSLITNDIAYVESSVPVNVNLKISGFSGAAARLVLTDNGVQIAERIIQVRPDQTAYSELFQYTPKQEGIRKLTATVTPLEGEITTKNNTTSEFIKVLRTKRQIVIFAGAPSPDLTFVKNEFTRDKNFTVKTYIQKQGAEYYEGNPDATSLKDAELIVLLGYPVGSTSQASLQLIQQQAEQGKPLFFIASQQTDYNKLKVLENYLPFTVQSSRPQEFLALPDVKPEAVNDPILKVTGREEDAGQWNSLPPLYRTETFVKAKPESQVLATIKVNNVALGEPLIISRAFQRSRSLAVLGYGLYRWKLLGEAADIAKGRENAFDALGSLVHNSTRWLSVNEDQKNVKIRTTKKMYASGEAVDFVAQVYDASYNPVENANVVVRVNSGGQARELVLTSLGSGRYSSSIQGLREGEYAFSGDAKTGGRSLGNDAGRFTIGELSLEYQNLRMNVELLRSLAERTGGKFYTAAEAGNFLNDIRASGKFVPNSITKRNEYPLWNLPWILGAALLAFAVEWFVRKRSGLV